MRKGTNYITALLLVWAGAVFAQSPTDWIVPGQSYIKIEIVSDDWYRVTGQELQAEGFPLSTVAAAQLQLFRRGQEVPINTQTVDGSAVLDYLEFWGEKNDGTADQSLYLENTQPHTYYNLFADTASYFLTWSSATNHLRIPTNTQNDNSGLSITTSHLEEDLILQTSDYATGRLFGGDGNDFQLSDYDEGEGWTGAAITKNNFQDFSFSLDALDESQTAPELEVIALGRNGLTHVVLVEAGPDALSLTEVGTFTFSSYSSFRFLDTVDLSQIGADGSLVVRCTVVGTAGATDRVSFSSIKLTYPQTLSLDVGEDKLFYFSASDEERYYLQITTPQPETYSFYDVSDPYEVVRLPQNPLTNRADLVVPGAISLRKVRAVSTPQSVASIKSHTLSVPDLSGKNYLIIAHPLLRNHPNGSDPISDYAQYRSSVAGGGHAVEVVDINEVYDAYNYGDPSVLGIRRLMTAAYEAGIRSALIVGKGRTTNQDLFRNTYDNPDSLPASPVFIPTYGIPGGDLTYSIGLDPNDAFTPAVAIGRINMWKPEQVTDYLQKVIEMEALPYDVLWRKNLIQLSGGTTAAELNTFSGYIEDFKLVAEGDYFGGSAQNRNKQTSAVSEQFDISREVNEGVGFITIFGHSSNTVTDVEIGKPSNTDFNYQNTGKYPMIIVNGCRAGEIFGNTVSFGEDWVSFPQKGSIGFIAHADQASSVNLKRFTDNLYEVGFTDTIYFGATMGEVLIEASKRYFLESGTADVNLTQIQQTLYQGDPALKFFGPSAPDFDIAEGGLGIGSSSGEILLAQQDSFLIRIPIQNFGRTIIDSIAIEMRRTYGNNQQQVVRKSISPIRYADTVEVYLTNPTESNIEGDNNLIIQLDPDDLITELDENNNAAQLNFFVASGATQHLLPYDQAVIVEDTVNLIWQSSDPYETSRSYQLLVDTTATFSSPFARQEVLTGENLLSYELDLSVLPEGKVIYWKTRFDDQMVPTDSIYTASSFTYLSSVEEGWGQFSTAQKELNEFRDLVLNSSTDELSFSTTAVPVRIRTAGTGLYSYDDLSILINEGDQLATINTLDTACRANTFNAMVFDRNTAQLKRPIAPGDIDVFEPLICGRLPQMIYNFTSDEILINRRIEELVNNMSDGDQVVFFNIDSVAYSGFDAAILGALEQVGVSSSIFSALTDGQPIVIFGQKGLPPGEANVEIDDGSALPPSLQTIDAQQDVIGTVAEGSFITPTIGPATIWQDLYSNVTLSGADQVSYELIAITQDGQETTLTVADQLDSQNELSSVDASQYPFMKVRFLLEDELDLTPAIINDVRVSYQGSPEGILIPASKQTIELQEGDSIRSGFSFVNVSKIDFQDSISAAFILSNVSSGSEEITIQKFPPVAAFDTLSLEYVRSTVGLEGQNSLVLSINTSDAERSKSNNRLTKSEFAEVVSESINPLIDVTVDGRYILDGELVSSRPMIKVTFKDENPFLLKSDTTGIELAIRKPEESAFQRIAFSAPGVSWTSATDEQPFEVTYQAELPQDGVYALRVTAQDESGNLAGEEPYEISFEVVNESTITHFYPYPNPFSTSCRFVFTLTGSQVPEDIRIQIMTVSGRIVKTIDEFEIGPLQIGNNITAYAWDGRDEYGDLLANGVYLYRVEVRQGGRVMKRRNTVADKAFRKGFGKLYILR